MKSRIMAVFAVVCSAVGLVFSSKVQTAESSVRFKKDAKCAIISYEQAYRESKAVFVGEVVSEEKNGDIRTFKFRVAKYWKGSIGKAIQINVYETSRYQAGFRTGESYLIYATADEDGNLRVGRCSRSKNTEYAGADLQKLGKGKKPRE